VGDADQSVETVVRHLVGISADGIVRVGRQGFAGIGTWAQETDGAWRRQPTCATFPLLEATSVVGAPSAALTAEWRATRRGLVALIDAGLVS
jgi:hypothetical protein